MRKKWKYAEGNLQLAMGNGQSAIGNGQEKTNWQSAIGNGQEKTNWQLAIGNGQVIAFCKSQIANCLLQFAICLLLIVSCGKKEEHKHIPTNKTSELDGLVQPANQTVFSDVKTISPIQKTFTPTLNATGVISYNPRLLNTISVRYSGRIEKLYVRFNFQSITKGQRIMDIYSPEILTAQQDFIFLLTNPDVQAQNFASLLNSSKQKLQLLGLTSEQLKLIETKKQVINPLPVYSSYEGHIHDIGTSSGQEAMGNKQNAMSNAQMSGSSSQSSQVQIENLPSSQTSALTIKEGMYVQSGQSLFAVYNISQVWAVLNIFPKDAALIKVGDKVAITSETNPDNVIDGTINYIEPVAGQNASAIKARVYLKNAENLHLKIGTILSAKILTHEINGMWLPRKSVVDLGQKQIVFIKGENHFITKNIQTGIVTDSLVQILSGLNVNEKVADNAQFLVDSESFIQAENK